MGGKKNNKKAAAGAAFVEPNADDPMANKDAGNTMFKAKKYTEAVGYYSRAIELDSTSAAFYSNRAFAYIHMKEFKKGMEDADSSITLDAAFARAYVRKAACQLELTSEENNFQAAITTCEAGMAQTETTAIKEELQEIMD